MQKRTRSLLFWLAVIVFGVATYVAILYAQGYKYDFTQNDFMRTGAIAITANTDAELFVDGRSAGPMALLTNRVGMSRLLPGTYTIKVVKEDYSSWSKTATVKEGLLTDFPHVLLLPLASASQPALKEEITQALEQSLTLADATPLPTPTPSATPRPKKPSPTPTPPNEIVLGNFTLRGTILYRMVDEQLMPLADKVLGFALTENSDRILWWTRNEVWVLWLEATDYQPFRSIDEQQLITKLSLPITRAAWFRDRDHIVIDLGVNGYRVIETDTRGGLNIIKI